MKRVTFFGRIARNKEGKVTIEIENRDEMAARVWEAISNNPTGIHPIRLTFAYDEKGRDSGDLAYYWAVVVPEIQRAMNDIGGNTFDCDDVHESLKQLFIKPNSKGIRSTGKMSESDFKQYIEKCCKFAAEFFGIAINPKSSNKFPLQEP